MKHKRSDLEGDHSHRVCGTELIQLADGRYELGIHVFSVSVWRCTTVTVVLGGWSANETLTVTFSMTSGLLKITGPNLFAPYFSAST